MKTTIVLKISEGQTSAVALNGNDDFNKLKELFQSSKSTRVWYTNEKNESVMFDINHVYSIITEPDLES